MTPPPKRHRIKSSRVALSSPPMAARTSAGIDGATASDTTLSIAREGTKISPTGHSIAKVFFRKPKMAGVTRLTRWDTVV